VKLLLDENGHVVVRENKPIYVYDDGKEVAFDAPATADTIKRLNAEAKSHRERAEAAEKIAKAFEGVDPDVARKALDTMTKLDQKKLVDAGEIDTVRNEISKAFQKQLDEISGKAKTLEEQLYAEKIGGSFSRSKFIADKLAIPADLVQARFGNAFRVEDGKTVAYDSHGNKIYSRARPGELADFDEAIETLVEQYPNRDSILKGTGSSGAGARESGGNGGGAPKGNLGGNKNDRIAAIAARFPELK
jgi:hypothetical protein